MMNRTLTIVLLSAAMVLPAFSQQMSSSSSSSTSTTSTVSQGDTATGKAPLQTTKPDNFWDGDEPSLGALIFHPYASKKYVQRHVSLVQDRVTELDQLTATNARMIKDVDTRTQQGIQLASAKADMADQHAMDAGNKAQTANRTATDLNSSLATAEASIGNLDKYNSASQTEIRFHSGQTALSKKAKEALDEIASQLKSQHGYVIEVQGFSSGQGQLAIANSRRMADAVQRYLVLNNEIPSYRIYVIGMGNASSASGSTGSRVEVSVLKNNSEQAAK